MSVVQEAHACEKERKSQMGGKLPVRIVPYNNINLLCKTMVG